MSCRADEHDDFQATVNIGRLTGKSGRIESYNADITVACGKCGDKLEWIGPDTGVLDANGAVVSMDRTELRIPLEPIGTRMRGAISVGMTVTMPAVDA